jgi:hypothetical protein
MINNNAQVSQMQSSIQVNHEHGMGMRSYSHKDNMREISERNKMLTDIIIDGDVSKMNREQKAKYVLDICNVTGLNPATQPFNFMLLKGKEVMYMNKQGAEELRQIHKISITNVEHNISDGIVIVKVTGHGADGREDTSIAVLPLPANKSEDYCNAIMKCETKAKRRFTLSICGLNILDQDTIQSIDSSSVPAEVSCDDPLVKQIESFEDVGKMRDWFNALPKQDRDRISPLAMKRKGEIEAKLKEISFESSESEGEGA